MQVSQGAVDGRDGLGMRLLSEQEATPYRFTLYFLAFTEDEPPGWPDAKDVRNRGEREPAALPPLLHGGWCGVGLRTGERLRGARGSVQIIYWCHGLAGSAPCPMAGASYTPLPGRHSYGGDGR